MFCSPTEVADPVVEDMLTRANEARFAFQALAMYLLGNGNASAPASYGPVAGNVVDVQALDRYGDVMFDNVEWGGGGGL